MTDTPRHPTRRVFVALFVMLIALTSLITVLAVNWDKPQWLADGSNPLSDRVAVDPASSQSGPTQVATEKLSATRRDEIPTNKPKLKLGEIATVAAGLPFIPMAGYPISRTRAHADRMLTLMDAKDHDGLIKESDGLRAWFARSWCKVKVIGEPFESNKYRGEWFVEVRIETGPYKGESGYVYSVVLNSSQTAEKADLSTVKEDVRKEVFEAHFRAMSKATDEAALAIGGQFDPEAKLMLPRKRYEFEQAAAKVLFREMHEITRKNKLSSAQWFQIINDGINAGWKYEFKDR